MFAVFDLDGTIANCDDRNEMHACPERGAPHLRSDIDWDRYFCDAYLDRPVIPIIKTMRAMHYAGYRVEIWTGRGAVSRVITHAWLRKYQVPYHFIRMRPVGDHTPDTHLKAAWMNEFGKPDIVFEDRQRVVDMWRSHGIVCAQVAPGNF